MCYTILTSVGGFFVVLFQLGRTSRYSPTRGRYNTMADTMVFMERRL